MSIQGKNTDSFISKPALLLSAKAIDPALDALFSQSVSHPWSRLRNHSLTLSRPAQYNLLPKPDTPSLLAKLGKSQKRRRKRRSWKMSNPRKRKTRLRMAKNLPR